MAHRSSKRYTALLSVRKHQEDIKGQALATVRREHAALRHQRRELEEQRRGVLSRVAVPAGGRVEPARIHALYQYERYLGKLTDEKDAEIALHASKVQKARAELESAMARRRIMEKLIERAALKERARVARTEQRMLDESSVIRFAHARRMERAGEAERDENRSHHHSGSGGLSGGRARALGD